MKNVSNNKPNRNKLRGFLRFVGVLFPRLQAVGIHTQQTIRTKLKNVRFSDYMIQRLSPKAFPEVTLPCKLEFERQRQ